MTCSYERLAAFNLRSGGTFLKCSFVQTPMPLSFQNLLLLNGMTVLLKTFSHQHLRPAGFVALFQ